VTPDDQPVTPVVQPDTSSDTVAISHSTPAGDLG
jgi:hypothetical protein